MFRLAILIILKDLRLLFLREKGLLQALLLGLLLIFMFSLASRPGQPTSPQHAATVFWLATAFCQILVFTQLYDLEEQSGAKYGLVLSPLPLQGVWLGKAIAAFLFILAAQALFLPAVIIFLGQTFSGPLWQALAALLLADMGLCALGSLMGAAGQGSGARESLLSIILFPMLVPLLLAAINLCALNFGASPTIDLKLWLGMLMAFDAIFTAAALLLFAFLYQGAD